MEDSWHPNTSITHLAKRFWINGFLAGLGVVAVIFMVWMLVREFPPRSTSGGATAIIASPSQTRQTAPPDPNSSKPAASAPCPVTAAVLKTQLEEVLGHIKAANQRKDLDQLLTFYSPTFPDLPGRAQIIAQSWQTCDFPKMEFQIEEVKPLADDRAFARVNWDIRVEDTRTKKQKKVTRAYLVWFVNESGEWRIQALKKAG
jgi:ketosteroid isomerase-like protein